MVEMLGALLNQKSHSQITSRFMKTFMCIRMFFIPLASRLVFSREDPEFHLVLSINARHFWSSMILGGGSITITVSCSVLELGEAVFEVRKAVSVIASPYDPGVNLQLSNTPPDRASRIPKQVDSFQYSVQCSLTRNICTSAGFLLSFEETLERNPGIKLGCERLFCFL